MPRAAFAVLLLAVLLLAGCGGVSHTVEIGRETVQASLEGSFPLTYQAPGGKLPLELVLSQPETLLEAGATQMGLRLKISVNEIRGAKRPRLPGPPPPALPPLEGDITVHGDIEYESATGEFFYRNCEITDLKFNASAGPRHAAIRRAATAALKLYLNKTAVYQLDGDNTQLQAARMLLKSVAVKDGKLLVEIGL